MPGLHGSSLAAQQHSAGVTTGHQSAAVAGACTLPLSFEMPEATSDPYKVQEITHLKGKPRAAEALELLQRVALQVQPIMRKRQWTVRKLSEFIPKSDNLLGLNVNRGAEVKIRLRPPGQEDSFYSWNHVLGTMLHELCHNKIGPHNAGEHLTPACPALLSLSMGIGEAAAYPNASVALNKTGSSCSAWWLFSAPCFGLWIKDQHSWPCC